MIIHDDYTRYTCCSSGTNQRRQRIFEDFLATVHDHGEVKKVRMDDGGEFVCDTFKRVCVRHCIKHEMTTADSP